MKLEHVCDLQLGYSSEFTLVKPYRSKALSVARDCAETSAA